MLEDTKQTIRNIVSEISQPSEEVLGDDTELLLSGRLDSLAVIRLATQIEQCSGIEVPPIDITIENFENLSAIFSYVTRRMSS